MRLFRVILPAGPAVVLSAALALTGCEDPGRTLAPEGDQLVRANGLPAGAVVASASGGGEWTIPAERFGFEVGNRLGFHATRFSDGRVSGRIEYQQLFLGNHIQLNARITCMTVWDGGTRVKYGGVVEQSNDPDLPPGAIFIWFQGIDNGPGTPDQSTIAGVGDEAANEAFCASSAPPVNRFDINGNIVVKG